MGGEGRHIVGVESGDGTRRWFGQRGAWIRALGELDDVHLSKAMARHSRIYFFRDSAEIFANEDGFVSMRFETENGVQFFGWIRDVSALSGRMSLRNPIKTMQAHDVIEAKHAGLTHLE